MVESFMDLFRKRSKTNKTFDKKFRDIMFLMNKLIFLKRSIVKEHDLFLKKLISDTLNSHRKNLVNVKKDDTSEIMLEVAFSKTTVR